MMVLPMEVKKLMGKMSDPEFLKKLVKKSISFKQDATFTGSSLVMSRVGG